MTQEGALLADTFGTPLLAYLCAADEEAITRQLEGQAALGQAQGQVLAELLTLATQLAANAAESNVPIALRLDVLGRFVQFTDRGWPNNGPDLWRCRAYMFATEDHEVSDRLSGWFARGSGCRR